MDAVIVADEQGIVLEWNPQAEAIFGWPRDEIVGQALCEAIIPASQRDAHQQGMKQLVETGVSHILGKRIETKALHRDGSEFPIELTITRLHESKGWLFSAFVRDLTDQKVAEEELRLAATTFSSHAGILITDANATILRVNPAFEAMTGYAAEEIVGQNPRILQSDRQDKAFYRRMWSAIGDSGQWQGELWNRRKDGSLYAEWLTVTAAKNAAGEITHYVGTSQDITERKNAEARFEHLAYHDDLTDLANRRLLHDRTEHEIAMAKRHGFFGALLYLDLDHFKHLNDALGHPVGDELLRQVAGRLKTLVREEDTVARVGGDEFVILLRVLSPNPLKASSETQAVAEKIQSRLSEPYDLQGHRYHISTSIGIVLFPEGQDNADDVLKHADSALYRAKDEGRNTARFYQPSMQAVAEARLALEKDLRHALEYDELSLHYQPQFNGDGELIGAEALIRWQHPEQGMILPNRFIPVAEDTGLILEIGTWVLRAAARQILAWQDEGLYPSSQRLAVNVSPRQFLQVDFVDQVLNICNEEGVPLNHMELEITESLVMENVDEAIGKMTELKANGIRFSIDDFGTGYSSLSYLRRLPVDQLKIDRSFVRDIVADSDDAAIIETIIAMTKHLELGVIAEGVETREQLDFLKEKGCTAFQGYYFSRPVPAEEFTRFFSSSCLPDRQK
jgi:diguanylate cyclase (GGDEF)-like protein/PAS domain S-box-containing protein